MTDNELQANAPERLYLQICEVGIDWIWSEEPAGDPDMVDVEYVRGDIARGHKQTAQELYVVLKEVEYVWDSTQELKICSWCYVLEGESHSDDCPIGNVLDKYRTMYGEEEA